VTDEHIKQAEDLAERLRFCEEHGLFTAVEANKFATYGEAADTIAALIAENQRLVEALGPFAACARDWINDDDEDDDEFAGFRLLIKDFRRARTAVEGYSNAT